MARNNPSWDRPIFTVGSPRSGTTLLRTILDAHPAIFCPPWETGLFVWFDRILNGDLPRVLTKHSAFPVGRPEFVDWARRGALDLFARFEQAAKKPRWAEKTPTHVLHMQFIHEVFPQAQFVHIIRNGYDVVRSLQNQKWAPRRIRWSTQRWMECVTAGRSAGEELGPALYQEIRYEDLLQRPEEIVRSLCAFLGEPFAPEMLRFNETQPNVWGERPQALSDKPVNHYRELGLLDRWIFRRTAGPLMRELGYWP